MRVIAGPEKKTRVMCEKERQITAYHEMGHAIVGHFLEQLRPDPQDLGHLAAARRWATRSRCRSEDKFLTTRAELQDKMAMTLGGRAAEEIIFDEITTGASNDLEKVTATAKQMVMRFGMSEKLGPRVFGHDHGQPFLGREFSSEPDYSDEIAREIDDEIRRIVEMAHERPRTSSPRSATSSRQLSEILIKRETIEKERVRGPARGASPRRRSSAPRRPRRPRSRRRRHRRRARPRRRAAAPAASRPRRRHRRVNLPSQLAHAGRLACHRGVGARL